MRNNNVVAQVSIRSVMLVLLASLTAGQGCPDSQSAVTPELTVSQAFVPAGTTVVVDGEANEKVALTVSVENAQPPCVVTFEFGDESEPREQIASPQYTLVGVEHVYTKAGQYTVHVSASDGLGRVASTEIKVAIADPASDGCDVAVVRVVNGTDVPIYISAEKADGASLHGTIHQAYGETTLSLAPGRWTLQAEGLPWYAKKWEQQIDLSCSGFTWHLDPVSP